MAAVAQRLEVVPRVIVRVAVDVMELELGRAPTVRADAVLLFDHSGPETPPARP